MSPYAFPKINVWLIHEAPNGEMAYETRRLTEAMQQSPFIQTAQIIDIKDLELFQFSSSRCLAACGEPVFRDELPNLVIARPDTLKEFPQWLPVLQYLESAGTLCVNSSESIRITADKYETYLKLTEAGIPTPEVMPLAKIIDTDAVVARLGFPVVMKQVFGTGGVGVALCHSHQQILETADAFRASHPDVSLIVQEFLGTSKGRDVRAVVRDGCVIASILRTSASASEFRSNHSLGGSVAPYDLSPEGCEIAVRTAEALNLKYAGIDLLFGRNGFQVCEANVAHGFKGLEEAHQGMDVAGEHLHYFIELTYQHLLKNPAKAEQPTQQVSVFAMA